MFKPIVTFHGPVAEHDMPCSICREAKAVFVCNEGYFEPCWNCQSFGWKVLSPKNKKHWFIRNCVVPFGWVQVVYGSLFLLYQLGKRLFG
jgi:hypothetical protein